MSTGFVTKFYRFPSFDKSVLKDFLLIPQIDNWSIATMLLSTEGEDNFALFATNDLSVFDKFEDTLMATEIEFPEFMVASKKVGTKYQLFYPSVDISSLF